jgi:hypothetical protein
MFETRALRDVPLSSRVTGIPASTLDDAVRICDPFTPLDPSADTKLREDLTTIRGGDRLAKIIRNIRRSGGIPTLHFLTGHLGSGKTTELLRMKQRLLSAEGGAIPQKVLLIDADTMLDRNDVDLEDILIALWNVVFREDPKVAAKALAPVWASQIEGALKSFVVNLPTSVPDAVGKVLGELRLPGIEQRNKVRVALGSVLSALITGLNAALRELRDEPSDSIVVLIDNLEKLSQGQRAGVERLYVERMGALKELDAHLVITVPLYLCYAAAGASLIGLYGGEVVVLPMIKVRKRVAEGNGDDVGGLSAMVHLLQKRVQFDPLFEGGSAAAEEIARLSGGCIRHALRMVQGAANEHDQAPVARESIQRSAASLQADFERALPEAWVPVLKSVARENRFPDDCAEDIKRDLLRHLFVLEYQNGEPDPWYAVHPLVERCRKYREHGSR